ncbi:unnamed protein product, partial [Musa acuminata subsp. burmannicoides]
LPSTVTFTKNDRMIKNGSSFGFVRESLFFLKRSNSKQVGARRSSSRETTASPSP